MKIKFSTYDELIEIEDLLVSINYRPSIRSYPTTYYKEYVARDIILYRGSLPHIFVLINDNNKSYQLTCYPASNENVYDMKNIKAIKNALLKPSYEGRTIIK